MKSALAVIVLVALSGCFLGSTGSSVCRASSETYLSLRPDVANTRVEAVFRDDGWTLTMNAITPDILRASKTYNDTITLHASATRQNGPVDLMVWAAVAAHAPYENFPNVELVASGILEKLHSLGDMNPGPQNGTATPAPTTLPMRTPWACIHGD